MATSADVARLSRVSRATVSNVINGTKYVSPELADRVLSAIQNLNYQPHGVARSLAARKTFSVGFIVPRIASTFYPQIISAVEKVLAKNGYSLILCDSDESAAKEEKNLRVIAEKRVDGLLWVPCSERNVGFVQSLAATGVSVVVVDRRLPRNEFNTVVSDNLSAGRIAAEYLIRYGYKRVAILTFSQNHAPGRERLEGFRAAFRAAGRDVPDNLVCITKYPEFTSACEVLSRLLKQDERPDAIFACSDLLTLAAVQEVRAAKLSVPRDIAILGFDDSPWGPFVWPPLTVITQDKQNLGTFAAHLLLKGLQKKRQTSPELIELPVTVVERGSCGERDSAIVS